MKNKLVSAVAAGALVLSPVAAVAQTTPAPAPETVSAPSALAGDAGAGNFVGVAFLLTVFVAFLLFSGEDEDDDEDVPVSP